MFLMVALDHTAGGQLRARRKGAHTRPLSHRQHENKLASAARIPLHVACPERF
jgi:hypothetical protein